MYNEGYLNLDVLCCQMVDYRHRLPYYNAVSMIYPFTVSITIC